MTAYEGSRKQRILLELQKGPCSASEMGAIIGCSSNHAAAHLGQLLQAGQVRIVGTIHVGTRLANLYDVPRGAKKP